MCSLLMIEGEATTLKMGKVPCLKIKANLIYASLPDRRTSSAWRQQHHQHERERERPLQLSDEAPRLPSDDLVCQARQLEYNHAHPLTSFLRPANDNDYT